jgi:cytochrome P450
VTDTPAVPGDPRDIGGFDTVREAWRCPHLVTAVGGVGEEIFHTGTINRLDGPAHAQRRKVMGELLKQSGHKRFRDTFLAPTARLLLDESLAAPSEDGWARMDLIHWSLRVNFRLAAALVGFDEGTSGQGAEDLLELFETVLRGRPNNLTVATGRLDRSAPEFLETLAARQEIRQRYFEPSMARRRDLVRAIAAGEAPDDALPLDLMSLMARELDPAWVDDETAYREALFLFNAGVHTSTLSLYWTLREVFLWLAENPGDRDRFTDEAFLLRFTQEALRVHPVTPGMPRRATAPVDLSDGTHIAPGEMVVIRSGPANLDPAAFGGDAAGFDVARRPPPQMQNYGYAFGDGPHKCFGLPIVMGAKGIDGSLLHLLGVLLAAGVEPDGDDSDLPPVTASRGEWVLEPQEHRVRFPAAAPQPATAGVTRAAPAGHA